MELKLYIEVERIRVSDIRRKRTNGTAYGAPAGDAHVRPRINS